MDVPTTPPKPPPAARRRAAHGKRPREPESAADIAPASVGERATADASLVVQATASLTRAKARRRDAAAAEPAGIVAENTRLRSALGTAQAALAKVVEAFAPAAARLDALKLSSKCSCGRQKASRGRGRPPLCLPDCTAVLWQAAAKTGHPKISAALEAACRAATSASSRVAEIPPTQSAAPRAVVVTADDVSPPVAVFLLQTTSARQAATDFGGVSRQTLLRKADEYYHSPEWEAVRAARKDLEAARMAKMTVGAVHADPEKSHEVVAP